MVAFYQYGQNMVELGIIRRRIWRRLIHILWPVNFHSNWSQSSTISKSAAYFWKSSIQRNYQFVYYELFCSLPNFSNSVFLVVFVKTMPFQWRHSVWITVRSNYQTRYTKYHHDRTCGTASTWYRNTYCTHKKSKSDYGKNN